MVDSMKRVGLLFAGLVLAPLIGLLVSQYIPLFGDSFAKLSQPWSQAKMSLIAAHVVVFLVLGIVGAFAGQRKFAPVKPNGT